MKLFGLSKLKVLALAATLSTSLWGANTALPGTLNYVEGQASLGSESLNAKSVGAVTLQPGQTVTTATGKAEVLLTPGVFLRLGDNSAVTMVSPNLTNTEASLDKGTAMVEVDDLHKANLLQIKEGDATARLTKAGLYQFDANQDAVRVFKGEALVSDAGKEIKVKSGHELDLTSEAKLKARKFDEKSIEQSDLYRFSSLRSGYLAEANTDAARIYDVGGGGWYGPGWYWDPMFTAYTWIPGDGLFYSPFGWGFYSPAWVWRAPVVYGPGYYRNYAYAGRPGFGYGRPGYGYAGTVRPGVGIRGPITPHPATHAFAGGRSFGVSGPSFHGGSFGGGGFHGGALHR